MIRAPGFRAGTVALKIMMADESGQSWSILQKRYTSASTGCSVKKSWTMNSIFDSTSAGS